MRSPTGRQDWRPQQNVSAKKIEGWVKEYVNLFQHAGEFPKERENGKGDDLAAHTDVLLPKPLRQELAAKMKAAHKPLIISADGALQQLPFEALLIQERKGEEGTLLIDLLPRDGIAYTPSLVILDFQERSEPSRFRPSLVTAARGKFASQNIWMLCHRQPANLRRFTHFSQVRAGENSRTTRQLNPGSSPQSMRSTRHVCIWRRTA